MPEGYRASGFDVVEGTDSRRGPGDQAGHFRNGPRARPPASGHDTIGPQPGHRGSVETQLRGQDLFGVGA